MLLDYVVIPVDDPAETGAWYADRLGLDVEWETEDFVLVVGEGGARLGLHRGDPPADPGVIQIHFEVDDVDETYRDLTDDGVAFSTDPTDTDWGYRTAACRDPSGYTVELFTPT